MSNARHLLLLRHGETDANATGVIQGQSHVPLNATGIEQAGRLARRIAAYDPRIDRIVSSDLRRAMLTAEHIGQATGLSVIPDSSWRERGLGIFEGRAFGDLLAWRAETGQDTPPGGEERAAMEARIERAVRQTLDRFGEGATIAVVTHGGAIQAVMNLLATGKLPLAADHPPVEPCDVLNCSILHLVVAAAADKGEQHRWSVRCANDAAHLSDMPLPRGRPNPDAPPLSRSTQV